MQIPFPNQKQNKGLIKVWIFYSLWKIATPYLFCENIQFNITAPFLHTTPKASMGSHP